MKLKNIITMCALALAMVGTGSLYAQDNGGGPGPGGPGGPGGQAGPGGPGGPGGGRRFDSAQMQQRMLERIQEDLGFTNDTDWSAVQPLVQKVLDARRDVGFGGMQRMFGRGRGGDQGGRPRGGGGMFGTPSAEEEALQKAVDDDAPSGQIKELLTRYQDSQKAKQAKLAKAQEDLRAILTIKQEASATLLGLLN